MIALSLNHFRKHKKLPVNAAVAEVEVAAEAAEPVVAVVLDHAAAEGTVPVVALKPLSAPLKS